MHTVLTPQLICLEKSQNLSLKSTIGTPQIQKKQFKCTWIHTVNRFLLILSDKGKHININIAQNYGNCQLPCLEKNIMALKGDKITFLILHSNKICTLHSLYSLQNHATHSFCNIFILIVRILSVAQVLHAIFCYLILGF